MGVGVGFEMALALDSNYLVLCILINEEQWYTGQEEQWPLGKPSAHGDKTAITNRRFNLTQSSSGYGFLNPDYQR